MKNKLLVPQMISMVLLIISTSIIFSMNEMDFISRVIVTSMAGILISFAVFGITHLLQKGQRENS